MDIGSWVQTWLNVITRPGEPAFEEERTRPYATLSTALIWVAVVSVITSLLSWLGGRIAMRQFEAMGGMQGLLAQAGLPADALQNLPAGVPFLTPVFGLGGLIASILFSIIGFLIFAGLLQLTARLLGGTGNYGKYAYLIATFFVPLSLISGVVSLVPVAGGCISLLAWIYQLVLAHFATRVEHKLSPGKSIVVVLAPLVIVLLLVFCFITVAAGAIFSIMNAGN